MMGVKIIMARSETSARENDAGQMFKTKINMAGHEDVGAACFNHAARVSNKESSYRLPK
jgi:hypothetical protein